MADICVNGKKEKRKRGIENDKGRGNEMKADFNRSIDRAASFPDKIAARKAAKRAAKRAAKETVNFVSAASVRTVDI